MMQAPPAGRREPRTDRIEADLVVVGGGLAGLCTAVTAARAGRRVVLVQDRPVLGGNASSEVRLWILGATAHMGNNNRWSREGGIIDEILLENLYRNPEGNPLILDTILLEKAVSEPNLTLLLNTVIHEVEKSTPDRISAVIGFCSQNSTRYELQAPYFCDASGDGIVGFLSGAAFRMGAESRDEFDEALAPSKEFGELLGHSLYFYTKDTGWPVTFVPPSFALQDVTAIPRWRAFNAREHGCQLWWIEYGGRLDTVHDSETIKWELWKIVYGVWNHIKNSGQFPEAETLTLEWVGQIPGKRESRRFEGDSLLTQKDIVEQRPHADVVSFGGWAIDLHPADGVFSELPSCNQYHSKGVYQIPYRCLYSRNIDNLFLTGRIISATHVAFGSTRVMASSAHNGQAVGMAAALCAELGCLPRDLLSADRMTLLQRRLLRAGQHLPGLELDDPEDLAETAVVTASSQLELAELAPGEDWMDLSQPRGLLIPVSQGTLPRLRFLVRAPRACSIRAELRVCSRPDSFTPDVVLARRELTWNPETLTPAGNLSRIAAQSHSKEPDVPSRLLEIPEELLVAPLECDFELQIEREAYVLVCLFGDDETEIALSDRRVSGLLTLHHRMNGKVATAAIQQPPPNSGVEEFEFWIPERRPRGKLPAVAFDPPLALFSAQRVQSGAERPTGTTNCWQADLDDEHPWLSLAWEQPQEISSLTVCLDGDFDHALESVLMHHPERTVPFCLPGILVRDAQGQVVASIEDNHQSRVTFHFPEIVTTPQLRLEFTRHPSGTPATVFRVRVFGPGAGTGQNSQALT